MGCFASVVVRRKPALLPVAVLGGAMLLLAIAGVDAATLRIGNGADPGSLDPHKAGGDWEDRIISELFEGLVAESELAVAIPGQAESWTISADGLVYTFTLRADARWSDSEPVVAQHFVDGFRRLFDPATAAEYAYLQFPIRNAEALTAGELSDPQALGVAAPDARTLVITLESPTPYFIEALAHLTALPIRADVIARWGDDWTQPGKIVGNGPYRLVEWLPGAYLRAVKSETYYGAEEVAVDEVRWENSQDLAAAFNRYRAGELDILTDFPADQYGYLLDRHPGEARVSPYLGLSYLVLNTSRPPFDDVRVRRALSISLGREVFGADVLGTGELPAYGWVPPGTANYVAAPYQPEWTAMPLSLRSEEARRLLAEAGFGPGNPLRLTLKFYSNENQRRVAVAVAAMWSEIGVETALHNSDVPAHFEALLAGNFEVGAAGWAMDYNDASNTLELLRSGTEIGNGYINWGNNYGRFSMAAVDQLLAQAAREFDLDARATLLGEAEVLLMEAFAAIPLYWHVSKNVVSPAISGFTDNAENIHRIRWMRKAEEVR